MVPEDVWKLLKRQSIVLQKQAESLVKRDEQMDRMIDLLEDQLKEIKKNSVLREDNVICAGACG